MYLFILLIVALNFVNAQDGDYERYIDLLPEEEKRAFLEKVARRLLVSGMKTRDARYKSSEELSEEELNQHKAFVRQVLAEESKNLRRNIKKNPADSAIDLEAKDKAISSAVDDSKYVDLTLRESNHRKKRNEEQKIDSDILNVLPVKNIFEGDDNIEKPKESNFKNGTQDLVQKDTHNEDNENTTGEDIQVRGPKKIRKVHDSLNVQRNVLSNEATTEVVTSSNKKDLDGKVKRRTSFSSEESDRNTPRGFTAAIYVGEEKTNEETSSDEEVNEKVSSTEKDTTKTTTYTNFEADNITGNTTDINDASGDDNSIETMINSSNISSYIESTTNSNAADGNESESTTNKNDDKTTTNKIETSTNNNLTAVGGNTTSNNTDVLNDDDHDDDKPLTKFPQNTTESTAVVVDSTTNFKGNEIDPNNSFEKMNDEEFKANYDSENYDENYRKNSSRKHNDVQDNTDAMQYFRSENLFSEKLNPSYSNKSNDTLKNTSKTADAKSADNKEIMSNHATDVKVNTLENDNKTETTTTRSNKPSDVDKDEQVGSDKKIFFREGKNTTEHMTIQNNQEILVITEKSNNNYTNYNNQYYTTDSVTSKTYVKTDNSKNSTNYVTSQNEKEKLVTREKYMSDIKNYNDLHYTKDSVTNNTDVETDHNDSQNNTERVKMRSDELVTQQKTSFLQTQKSNLKEDLQDYDYLTRRNITDNENTNYSKPNYGEKRITHKIVVHTDNTKLEATMNNNLNSTKDHENSVLKPDILNVNETNTHLKSKYENSTDDKTVPSTNHLKVPSDASLRSNNQSSFIQNGASENNKTENIVNIFEELVNTTFELKDANLNTDELFKSINQTKFDSSSSKLGKTKGNLRGVVAGSHTLEPESLALTTAHPFYQIFYWRNISKDLRANDLKELKNVNVTHLEQHAINTTKNNKSDDNDDGVKSDEMEFVSQSVNLEKIQHSLNYKVNIKEEENLGYKENSNPHEEKKVKEYLVYEVPEGQSPFVVKNSPKYVEEFNLNQEQPYYVPIYNYAPENVYYNAYNRLGLNNDDNEYNDQDLNKEVIVSPSINQYTDGKNDKGQDSINNNKDYRKFKFSVKNKPNPERPSAYFQNIHLKRPTIKLPLPIVFKKPKKTEIFLNYDDYFDMEYMKRKGKSINRAHYDDYVEPLQIDGVYNSLVNQEAKSHLTAVRQMMYKAHYFGYEISTPPPKVNILRNAIQENRNVEKNWNHATYLLRAQNGSGVMTVNGSHNSRNNDDISVDYYFGVTGLNKDFNLRSELKENGEYNKTVNSVINSDAKRSLRNDGDKEDFLKLAGRGIVRADAGEEKEKVGDENEEPKPLPNKDEEKGNPTEDQKKGSNTTHKNEESNHLNEDTVPKTIRDIVNIGYPTDAFEHIEKLKSLNISYMRVRKDEEVLVYTNVLSDMVEMDNKALKQYDWLGSTVDILSALHKLKKMTNNIIEGRYVHPADGQLLKYVLHLYKLANTSKDNPNSLRKEKKRKHNALPRNTNRPKEYLKAKGLLDRVWLYIRARLIANKQENVKELKEFSKFLDDLEESLFDLHNAIKHIAMVTKFKKQKWYENLKQLYVRCKERKHILELLIHLFTARFLGLIEESAMNGLEGGYANYVEENGGDVKRSVDELVFILKILEQFRSNDLDKI